MDIAEKKKDKHRSHQIYLKENSSQRTDTKPVQQASCQQRWSHIVITGQSTVIATRFHLTLHTQNPANRPVVNASKLSTSSLWSQLTNLAYISVGELPFSKPTPCTQRHFASTLCISKVRFVTSPDSSYTLCKCRKFLPLFQWIYLCLICIQLYFKNNYCNIPL